MTEQPPAGIDVLHVPFSYFPDPVGGTEIYVAGLIAALKEEGFSGAVAAPGARDADYDHDGIPVYRFARMADAGFEQAHGLPDLVAAQSFTRLLSRIRPRFVHLHAHTAAVSGLLVDAAHAAGAKVVLTYHTPTVSCPRGTMMLMGKVPCDGALYVRRCTSCVLQSHGVVSPLRQVLAYVPPAFGKMVTRTGISGAMGTALRMSGLVAAKQQRFLSLMNNVDRVVAVCQWVADVLSANGIDKNKLVLCRQGLVGSKVEAQTGGRPAGLLRLGYFGRIDPTKGVDILVEALRRMPDAAVSLDIYGVGDTDSRYFADLRRAISRDRRVVFRATLDHAAVPATMRDLDFVVVPSRWLETGPLVVLEAFAAGAPVLGAATGGIAELVSDGVDGLLIEPNEPGAWRNLIAALAADPAKVAQLRNGVRPPRTTWQVACEMAALYGAVAGH